MLSRNSFSSSMTNIFFTFLGVYGLKKLPKVKETFQKKRKGCIGFLVFRPVQAI